MLYGIIYDRGGGKYAFMMRQYTTFRSLEEENSLLPHIVAIIEEETGDGFLLAEKIAQYVREHHLTLEIPLDLTGISRAASLSDAERMEMLGTSVRALAQKLDESQRKTWELEFAHWCANKQHEVMEYLLGEIKAIIGVAQIEFYCKHIARAFEKYEKDKQERLH